MRWVAGVERSVITQVLPQAQRVIALAGQHQVLCGSLQRQGENREI